MVISLIILVMTLVVPALNGIKGAGDVTKAAYDISGALDQARAYAVANNTYVYVGIAEVDANVDSSSDPQRSGTGRLAIATVASKDGTRGYDVNSMSLTSGSSVWSNYNNGLGFTAVGSLVVVENTHIAPFISGSTGSLSRPPVQLTGSNVYSLGSSQCTSVTSFDWPLGRQLTRGKYSFKKVINFDPQGIARIQYLNNADMINDYMEIDLQQTHGTAITTGSAVAIIQIDSMTGSNRIYRP